MKKETVKQEQIVIYQSANNKTKIEVRLKEETVWMTQKQMAELFGKNVMTINEHIKNVYKEGELERSATIRKFLIVQKEGKRLVNRELEYYSLDTIISIGYRVKSKSGTQFRIWANKILKEYLVKGYAINEILLKEKEQQLTDLKQTVKLLENVLQKKSLNSQEATGLLRVITDYTYALDVLDKYDHERLVVEETRKKEIFKINYKEARKAIGALKDKFGGSELFGNEKDKSFVGSLIGIYQTFDGKDLYPSVEEKAANLLYFITKNHSFSDGNKRIAAFIFVWFLERNKILYNDLGQKRIADNALVALTLMIAESKSEEKDTMVKLIVNLINKRNN
jgi:prophage maintenance system killer protein